MAPPVPTPLTPTGQDRVRPEFTWTAEAGATKYEVACWDIAAGSYAFIQEVGAVTTYIHSAELGVEKNYRFKVRAGNGGWSVYSSWLTFNTLGAGEGPYGGAVGDDGGYLDFEAQGDSSTDTSGVKGSAGGGGTGVVGGDGGTLIRLFARSRFKIGTDGVVFADGDAGGDGTAGKGAGGGVVCHCDGPYGVEIAGAARTLGGGGQSANGGSLKRFTLPGKLSEPGSVDAGRLFSDTDLQRAYVIT